MKKKRQGLLAIISILGILFSTSCQQNSLCKSYYASVQYSRMRVGDKQPIIYHDSCKPNLNVYVSFENEGILKYDYETRLLEALEVGYTEVSLVFGSYDEWGSFTIYVIK